MTIQFVGQTVQEALPAALTLAHTADEAACQPQWACDRTLADSGLHRQACRLHGCMDHAMTGTSLTLQR